MDFFLYRRNANRNGDGFDILAVCSFFEQRFIAAGWIFKQPQ